MTAIVLGGLAWYRHTFPYGQSHSCIKAAMLALEQYADDHGGHYPAGEASPEASLSLLHRPPYALTADVLRGKTAPLDVVRNILDWGGLLGPDTCGWHYVEGLTQNDDRRLALLWDKVGLGHFGQRFGDGSREVLFVGGELRMVSGREWPQFLEEQRQLLAERDDLAARGGPVLTATIRWPGGEVSDRYDGPYRIEEEEVFQGGRGRGEARQGDVLRPPDLRWRGTQLLPDGATKTWVLVLPQAGMRSRPVTVRVAHGRPSPSSVCFEMERAK